MLNPSQAPGDHDSEEWQALIDMTKEQYEQQYDTQHIYRLHKTRQEPLVDYVPKGQATEPTPPKSKKLGRKSTVTPPQPANAIEHAETDEPRNSIPGDNGFNSGDRPVSDGDEVLGDHLRSGTETSPPMRKEPIFPSFEAEAPRAERSRDEASAATDSIVGSSKTTEQDHRQADTVKSIQNDSSTAATDTLTIYRSRPASERFVPKLDPKDPARWFKEHAAWAKERKEAVARAAARASQSKASEYEAPKYPLSAHMHKLCSCMAFCRRSDEEEDMVSCSTRGHENRWFHLGCANLKEPPSEDEPWFCPDCRDNTSSNASKHPVFSRHPTTAIHATGDERPKLKSEPALKTIKEHGLRSWTSGWSIQEEQCILDIVQGLIEANEKDAAEHVEKEEAADRHQVTGPFRNLDALFIHVSNELWNRYGFERTRSAIRSHWDGVSGLRNRAESAAEADERDLVRQAEAAKEAAETGVSPRRILGSTGSAGGVRLGGAISKGVAPELRSIRGIKDLDARMKQLLESKGIRGAGPGQSRKRKKVGTWGKGWTGEDDRGVSEEEKRKNKRKKGVTRIVDSDEDEDDGEKQIREDKNQEEDDDEPDNENDYDYNE